MSKRVDAIEADIEDLQAEIDGLKDILNLICVKAGIDPVEVGLPVPVVLPLARANDLLAPPEEVT